MDEQLTREVLSTLGFSPERLTGTPPTLRLLNRFMIAYTQRVPWESVFRIAKRRATSDISGCPRWPEEFWQDALHCGGGGTCYESNYAFFQLLTTLGFPGYLTLNDMDTSRGCHSAIVITLHGQKYLVDVGIPIQAALPFQPDATTRRYTAFHTLIVRPDGPNRYQIERTHHPKRNVYTFYDLPVSDEQYRQIIELDYDRASGLFLDRVIIVKVIGDRLWRFNSREQPYRIEGFNRSGRVEIPLSKDTLAYTLADHFSMQEEKIAAALDALRQIKV